MLARLLALLILLFPLPLRALQFATRGDTVFAMGDIIPGDPQRLAAILTTRPITRLLISSPGGLVNEGWELSQLVHDHYLTIEVRDQCSSMCSLMFAAAARRRVSHRALIGVHSIVTPQGENDATLAQTMRIARQMDALGVPAVIIGRMVITPPLPHPIARLTPAELDALGVEWLD